VHSPEPYSHATMSRMFAGTASANIVEAIEALTGITLPARDMAADEALWLELGQRLKAANQRLFLDTIHLLRDLVEVMEKLTGMVDRKKR